MYPGEKPGSPLLGFRETRKAHSHGMASAFAHRSMQALRHFPHQIARMNDPEIIARYMSNIFCVPPPTSRLSVTKVTQVKAPCKRLAMRDLDEGDYIDQPYIRIAIADIEISIMRLAGA